MRIFTRSLKTQFIEAFTLLILLSSCFLAAITGREASSEARYERGLLLTNRVQSLAKALDQSMWFWIKEVDTLRHTVGLIGGDMKKLSIAVNRLQDTMPAFAWIGLMNPQGKVFVATDGVLEGTDLSICAIFRQGKNGLFVGDVRKASLLAQLLPQPENGPLKFVDISMPIGEGELKDWVLVAHLSWAWAREVEEFILSGEGSDTNTKIMVLGADGSVILGGDNNEKPLALPLLQELEHSTSAWAVETWPDGIAYLTAAVSCTGFKDYDGLQWSVVARQSLDAAYEPVRRLVARILVADLLLAVLFALVAGYIAQRTIAPLKALTAAADRLSRGERVTIPRNRGIREIEVLSASLSTLVENLTRTEKDRNRIQHAAERDALTGLLNRHGLAARIDEAMPSLTQNQGLVELLYMDLDGFKPINDAYGHHVGDAVLTILGQRLTRCLRKDDVLVRLGGDEFLALLGHTRGTPDILRTINRIREDVGAPISIDGLMLRIGISIGHATWHCANESVEDALKRADSELYMAKRTSKASQEVL